MVIDDRCRCGAVVWIVVPVSPRKERSFVSSQTSSLDARMGKYIPAAASLPMPALPTITAKARIPQHPIVTDCVQSYQCKEVEGGGVKNERVWTGFQRGKKKTNVRWGISIFYLSSLVNKQRERGETD